MSGWHEGERALQERTGVADRLAELGSRVLRDHMPEQHRNFFAELPLLFTGTLDGTGWPWASLLAGAQGFVTSPTPRTLRIAAAPLPGDPAARHWRVGAPVGLLGLQAHTGRRNRMNGRVAATTRAIEVEVGQSFGNCPKYIHPREAVHAPAAGEAQVAEGAGLLPAARAIVEAADTFFIASAHPRAGEDADPRFGVDVSHRGGAAGFVRIAADGVLLAPDYTGNSFFNTLGNLQLEPRCGLLFVDFATGDRLHLACRAQVLADRPDPQDWPGALRLLRFQVERTVLVRGGLPLRWERGGRT